MKSRPELKYVKAVALTDGLYEVTTPYLCAAFVVERGRLTQCAPILRRRIEYWITQAKRIGPPPNAVNDDRIESSEPVSSIFFLQ